MAFRTKGDIVGAVDFGTRAVRVLVALRQTDGTVQILGHGAEESRGCVSQGVIQDRGAAQTALKRALSAAESEAHVKVESLFCGINSPEAETFVREGHVNIDHGTVEPQHIAEALDLAQRDLLAPGKKVIGSVSAQQWFIDNVRVQDPIAMRGQVLRARVHFARFPSVIIDNIAACVDSQRRELEDIVLQPMAAAMGCLTPEEMELGVAVLDLGRGMTGLAVYRDHCLVGSHVFEWGGVHFIRDVSARLRITYEEADDLVQEYGVPEHLIAQEAEAANAATGRAAAAVAMRHETSSVKLKSAVPGAAAIVPRSILDEAIFDRAMDSLVGVRQHINALGLSKHLVRGVVMTGGSSQIKAYTRLAESVFQVPCRVGAPGFFDSIPHAVCDPAFSAAVGIVRHGFAYRAAARNGRVDARGPLVGPVHRLMRAIRKYFL